MLSNKAKNITPSPTLAISAKAKELINQGLDVISFGAGEPDFNTPENIKNKHEVLGKKMILDGICQDCKNKKDNKGRE